MNLKDEYNKAFIQELSNEFTKHYSLFDSDSFINSTINKDWEARELKDRMRWITKNIHSHLDLPYSKQIELLIEVSPHYSGLKGMIFPDFVQVHGLSELSISLKALELFTQYSTSEFAIRPFIEKYPEKTKKQLMVWSLHKNHHLRRLASEGSRPKLPWAAILQNFVKDPSPNLPILENLKNDDSLYVKKSVANHLNDISKNQPELVIEIAKKWHGKTKNTDWIVKHALRTLLKKGNKKALAIFDLDNSEDIEIKELTLSNPKIRIGEFTHFEFELHNQSSEKRNIRLEYSIDYVKANGKTSAKVFQLSEFNIPKNSKKTFKRKQWFKELSTRKHYPGKHQINLIINGDVKENITLDLV